MFGRDSLALRQGETLVRVPAMLRMEERRSLFFMWQGETLAIFLPFCYSIRFPFFVLRVPAIFRGKRKRSIFF